jgi:hypothetical protein
MNIALRRKRRSLLSRGRLKGAKKAREEFDGREFFNVERMLNDSGEKLMARPLIDLHAGG